MHVWKVKDGTSNEAYIVSQNSSDHWLIVLAGSIHIATKLQKYAYTEWTVYPISGIF